MTRDPAEPNQAEPEARSERARDAEPVPFPDDTGQQLRLLEALLFAAAEPLDEASLAQKLPEGADLRALIDQLTEIYEHRGINLVPVAKGWAFRTAPDLAKHLSVFRTVKRRFSRAALETLAIIAYHQPITRAEIEEVRGVGLSRGTLDQLLEVEWIKPRGRRRAPGRPITWVTTQEFLNHFGLHSLDDLPGVEELKAAGLLDLGPGALPQREGLAQDEDADDDEPGDELDDDLGDEESFAAESDVGSEGEARRSAAATGSDEPDSA